MDSGSAARAWAQRLQRAYSGVAHGLLPALLVFSFANALLPERLRARHDESRPATVPGAAAIEYEPFTSYRPRRTGGPLLNVSPDGYRHVRLQGPWPPAPEACSVFVFGGSTAFGAALPDHGSIPSLLGDRLSADRPRPVHVYNFARPGYVAIQERLLLERLLAAGRIPHLAVFVDGPDEFHVWPRPLTADIMRGALEAGRSRSVWSQAADWLASLPAGRALRAGIEEPRAPSGGAAGPPEPARALREWLANKRLVEELMDEFDSRALFVWQPASRQAHDLALQASAVSTSRPAPALDAAGEELRRWRRDAPPDASFLWLGDLARPHQENAPSAGAFEAAAFAEEVSRRVAEHVKSSGLLACSRAPR